ncbi:MAG TPA: hypothetical protein VEG64_16745 [Candidatus Sulfotelmatobacter sp.]|nr:hypothetical protein [Candidatus Sulfotelmatobacter sp.]
MPEVAIGLKEFEADAGAPRLGVDINHAALARFFGEPMDEQKRLSAFDFRRQGHKAAVRAHLIGFCYVPEGLILRCSTVNPHWNG